MRVGAVLLAAGASRRMGTNKLLLPWDGEPLVRRAARALGEAGADPLVVVTGHDPAAVHGALGGISYLVATNHDFTGPTSGSLHAGLRGLPPGVDAALVLLADMPFVTAAMCRALVHAQAATGAPLAVSRYGGDVPAPPVLFTRALWPELLAWTGEGCGKAVVAAHATEAAYCDWPGAALRDVDTPEDWAALLP